MYKKSKDDTSHVKENALQGGAKIMEYFGGVKHIEGNEKRQLHKIKPK